MAGEGPSSKVNARALREMVARLMEGAKTDEDRPRTAQVPATKAAERAAPADSATGAPEGNLLA